LWEELSLEPPPVLLVGAACCGRFWATPTVLAPSLLLELVGLGAGLGRAHHLAVGIENLLPLGHTVVVDVGADGDPHLVGAEMGVPAFPRSSGHTGLDRGAGIGRLGGGLALAVVRAAGQERALLVDDRDRLRLQVRHGLGDQILDRHHLLAAEGGGAAHDDEDRGGRLRGLALERLALGQHEMDRGRWRCC